MKTLFLTLTLLTTNMALGAIGDVKEIPFTVNESLIDGEKYEGHLKDDPYFKIAKVTVTEIEAQPYLADEKFENKNLGAVIMTIEKLIALGTKIYDIVKKGKPVTNLSFAKPVSVLPQAEDPNIAFNSMTGWSLPKARTYKIEYKNLLGMSVIGFDYTVYFQHSGQFEDKGAYITGLTVRASNVSVAWGFEFNASSSLETITNRGSRVNPTAGATMRINYSASSLLNSIQSSESFFVTGDGEMVKF
ncbi:MAG: hypothetical protein NXH75_18130 [Halobacteriovoraceae bacterium]|nr:hypothetical protein [Halobacteriovoraceae bacterium]